MATLGELRGLKERVASFFRGIHSHDFLQDRAKIDEMVERAPGVSRHYAEKELKTIVAAFTDPQKRVEFSRQIALIERAIMLETGFTADKLADLHNETKLGDIANELYNHLIAWLEEEFRSFAYYFTHGD